MGTTSSPAGNSAGRGVLVAVLSLSFVLVSAFWVVVSSARMRGASLYVTQLALYGGLFLLAVWGLRRERITVLVSARKALETVGWSLVGWLVFVVVIQILGLTQLSGELHTLANTSPWRIGAQVLATWLFVGLGEELLFRGYFLEAFRRHVTSGTDRRRTTFAVVLSSLFFSVWHLPSRVMWLITGEADLLTLVVSLFVLFAMAIGFAYLFIRSGNLLLVALVHGVMDYPLVGASTQLSPVILLVAIGGVEVTRLVQRKRTTARGRTESLTTG